MRYGKHRLPDAMGEMSPKHPCPCIVIIKTIQFDAVEAYGIGRLLFNASAPRGVGALTRWEPQVKAS